MKMIKMMKKVGNGDEHEVDVQELPEHMRFMMLTKMIQSFYPSADEALLPLMTIMRYITSEVTDKERTTKIFDEGLKATDDFIDKMTTEAAMDSMPEPTTVN